MRRFRDLTGLDEIKKYGSSDRLSMQDRVDRRRADLVSVKSPFPTLIARKSK